MFPIRAFITLFVPLGSKDAYAADEVWKGFKNIIEYTGQSRIITFADANVKALCVQNWDFDSDGELSEEEAAAVTNLGEVFKGSRITTFEELQYFTGLTSLPSAAFQNSNLTKVIIPNTVTTIENAFWQCGSLTSVVIPKSVTSISGTAFYQCNKLYSVTVKWEVPLAIPEYLFTNRTNATLYVPAGYTPAYKTADYWKDFYKIVGVGPLPGDLNSDGVLDDTDLAALTNLILTNQYNASADLNNDGKVNGIDYVLLVKVILSFTSN